MLPSPLLEGITPVDIAEDQVTLRVRTAQTSPNAGEESKDGGHGHSAMADEYPRQRLADKEIRVDSWCRLVYASREHAELIRELHEWNPEAADRLARALMAMPALGSDFLDFHLQAQLGYGAFARVYLARQGEQLANRPVVVKITADLWGEAHTLAQLRHPNIVPVYSVHHRDPFQVVCMPYLGCTTLFDVLRHVKGLDQMPRSGATLAKAIKKTPGESALAPEPDGSCNSAMWAEMASLSYVEAVVWLAAQVADGLTFAHEHGIIHHDLKPANILLTNDGRPMLLDFNAAKDTKRPQEKAGWVAGTLPYMAPEQIAALQGDPSTVDPRSDLFSFGVILFELLTGRYPFKYRDVSFGELFDQLVADRRCPPPHLRNWNPAVSPALEAIVRRCLEPDLNRRYQTARELCEDLQRQREHLPLLHQPEPSQAERMRKGARRHPRLVWIGLIGLLSAIMLSASGLFALNRDQELEQMRAQEIERAENEKQRAQAISQLKQFRADMRTVQFILYTRINEPEQRADGIKLGRRLIEMYDVDGDPAWHGAPMVQSLSADDRQQLGDAMGELLLLVARGLRLEYSDVPTATRDLGIIQYALRLNERAESCSPQAADSPGLWIQRAALNDALGRHAAAGECRTKAAALPMRTVADSYWLASNHVATGRLGEAVTLLQDATSREPQSFWAWFVLASCYDRIGNDIEAKACYGTCVAFRPDFEWVYFNRGLVLLRKQEFRGACADFDTVLKMRPELVDGYLNRALARQGLLQFREAEQDLTAALERGGPTRLYFLRARVREKIGDKDGGQRDFEAGVKTPPSDEKSWITRGYYLAGRDPKMALADLDRALRINPRSVDALQNKAHVLAEKLGQNQQALAVLDELLEFYPESVKARSGRGVLYARLGQREPALRDAQETLRRDSSPPRLYQVACIYALTSKQAPEDRVQAFQLLSSSLRQGYGFHFLDTDDDLNNLRPLPEFRRLVDAARALRTPLTMPKKS